MLETIVEVCSKLKLCMLDEGVIREVMFSEQTTKITKKDCSGTVQEEQKCGQARQWCVPDNNVNATPPLYKATPFPTAGASPILLLVQCGSLCMQVHMDNMTHPRASKTQMTTIE
mmetsp:Transcript_39971/g.128167  ORF Transcript_39971/g.128167 Transcript_39971/m.128167 type:complete len:115 (+) Transcript_39971:68-412(+)